jgi:hypothetical protein
MVSRENSKTLWIAIHSKEQRILAPNTIIEEHNHKHTNEHTHKEQQEAEMRQREKEKCKTSLIKV